MNSEHIKIVFTEYIVNPHEGYAILINGPWGSGKTFFWENELKPIAEAGGKKTLYISLNGINSRVVLEQILFIRMWKFLNRNENHRKNQFLQLLGNAASTLTQKKLDINLPELLRGLAIESGIDEHYLLCFDDLERCQLSLSEVLGFINDFVEHRKLKTLILSDESQVHKNQPDFAGIKEKLIGRTFNFRPNHAVILPRLMQRYDSDNSLYAFLQKYESYIRDLLTSFKEDNLRIIDACLAIIARLYLVFKGQNEKSIPEVLLCTLTITIDYKRGYLNSQDVGDYKELHMIPVAQQFWSQPTNDGADMLSDIIKGAYPKAFFDRYLKGLTVSFHLWNSVFDFILSGYLDEVKLRAEFESRDPDRVPDHLVCFPLVVNYKFRHLSDDAFLINAEKTLRYAEEGLYSIYDYLQIAVFYFYFSDKGLISLDYERILISLRKGLGKAAQRGEIDDDKYRNLMHFQRDNPVAEEFKQEISMVHINIIRQQKQSIMRRINGHIREGEIDEITKLFQEHQADNNLLPAAHMEDMCQMITEAPNRSISQLAVIFEERYNAGLCQLLTDDAEPLQILDSHLDMLLLITAKGVRQFVLREFSKAIKEGIIGVNHAKKHPLKSRRSTLGTVAPGETQEE